MAAATLTLIGTPISHYVQTVILTCEEKGIPYQLQVAGHDTPAALRSPEHRRWHPFGRIPAIQHNDIQLYETSAICRYLDLAFGEISLVPESPLAAARMEQWVSALNSYFHGPCISRLVGQYVFPRGPNGTPDREVIDAALPEVKAALEQLEAGYSAGPYLAGEQLSLADLFAAPLVMQLLQTPEGQDCLEQCAAIQRGLQLVAQRPAFIRMQALHRQYLPAGNRLSELVLSTGRSARGR